MKGKKLIDVQQAMALFEAGWKMTQIAAKFDVTKQAVSERLRGYYSLHPATISITCKKVCRVCGIEDVVVLKKVNILDMGRITFSVKQQVKKHICITCKKQNRYRCTSCGLVDTMESGRFLKNPVSVKNRRARCLKCNREGYQTWSKKNKKRALQIQAKYRRKKRVKN